MNADKYPHTKATIIYYKTMLSTLFGRIVYTTVFHQLKSSIHLKKFYNYDYPIFAIVSISFIVFIIFKIL